MLLTGAGTVRAQLMTTFSTSTAVASGGTVTFAVTTSGVAITSMSSIPCAGPTPAFPASSVSFTCASGLASGTFVQQTFSVPSGSPAETVTYNANGPTSGSPSPTTAGTTTTGCGSLGATIGSTATCVVSNSATTVAGLSQSYTVSATGTTIQIGTSGAPSLAGSCNLSTGLPTPATVTYVCSTGQSVPNGFAGTITITNEAASTATSLGITTTMNVGGTGAGAIPAPTTQTVNASGSSSGAVTITSIDPSSGGPGTQVQINGSNLSNITAINFGSSTASILGCNFSGTSCMVSAPNASFGTTVNVSVVTSAGTSNTLPFTYGNGGGPGPIFGPGGGFYFGPTPPPPPSIGANTISLPPGWNLIGGAEGASLTGTPGPLYTYQGGGYQIVNAGTGLQPGLGYWAYLPTGGSLTLPVVPLQAQSIPLPPGQWVMIGNPSSSPVQVLGGDVVYTYSPVSNYQITNTLQPGEGAWIYSFNGGTLTIQP